VPDSHALLILHEHERTGRLLVDELAGQYTVYLAQSIEGARRLLSDPAISVMLVSKSLVAASGPAFLELLSQEFPRIRPLVVAEDNGSAPDIDAITALVRETLALEPAPSDARDAIESDAIESGEIEPAAERSEVFGTAAHDLRNPLSVILSLTELMLHESSLVQDDVQQFLEAIRANADEMHRLLDDVQEIARLEAGRTTLARADTPLEPLLEGAADDAGVVNASLVIAREATHWSLDESRMRRALSILLADAGARARSCVLVGAERNGEMLCIAIADDGPQLARDAVQELSDSFRRGRRRKGDATGGTALGPALAARIIESHGGSIVVEALPPHGTRIVVRIPRG
jgi:signal transduction histidine kinase